MRVGWPCSLKSLFGRVWRISSRKFQIFVYGISEFGPGRSPSRTQPDGSKRLNKTTRKLKKSQSLCFMMNTIHIPGNAPFVAWVGSVTSRRHDQASLQWFRRRTKIIFICQVSAKNIWILVINKKIFLVNMCLYRAFAKQGRHVWTAHVQHKWDPQKC